MKSLTDFLKMVETGVDPCLSLVTLSLDVDLPRINSV